MTAKHKIIITRNFKTKKEIKNGLMNIKYLKPNEGALFNMKTNRKHHFWMKNTLIPLDMIFMNKSNKVVGIVKNAKPYDESLYYINVASEKIIEIQSGYVGKNNIKIGDNIELIYKIRPKSTTRNRKVNKKQNAGRYTRKNKY